MSKGKYNPEKSRRDEGGLNRLISDINTMKGDAVITLEAGEEMLSLIIDEALKGVDIAKRYPSFFKKMLQDIELQQEFLSVLESLSTDKNSGSVPLPDSTPVRLDFLNYETLKPIIQGLDKNKWKISWERSANHLQAIFSPRDLAYRSDLSILEDAWFTILRDELIIDNTQIGVVLDGMISKDMDNAIDVYIKVAFTDVVLDTERKLKFIASIQWGGYQEKVLVNDFQGVFPSLPIIAFLDESKESVVTPLKLTIEADFT